MKYHLDLQSCWKTGLQRVGPKVLRTPSETPMERSGRPEGPKVLRTPSEIPMEDAYGKRGGLVLIMKLDIEKACNK